MCAEVSTPETTHLRARHAQSGRRRLIHVKHLWGGVIVTVKANYSQKQTGDYVWHKTAGWSYCREELHGNVGTKTKSITEFSKLASCVMRNVYALCELVSLSSKVR